MNFHFSQLMLRDSERLGSLRSSLAALVDSDNESHDNEDRVLDAKMEDDVKGKPKVEDENEEEDGGGYEEGEDDSELDVYGNNPPCDRALELRQTYSYIVEQILEHRSDFEDVWAALISGTFLRLQYADVV